MQVGGYEVWIPDELLEKPEDAPKDDRPLGEKYVAIFLALNNILRELKVEKEDHHRIQRVYEPLYRKWWIRLFFCPLDPYIDGRFLVRCNGAHGRGGCGKYFWSNAVPKSCTGNSHLHGNVKETSLWVHLKAKLGLI